MHRPLLSFLISPSMFNEGGTLEVVPTDELSGPIHVVHSPEHFPNYNEGAIIS